MVYMPTALKIVQNFYPQVTSVKDSRRAITIEVTKADCSSKAVKDHKDCALARACKREYDIDGVLIALRVAYLVKGKEATRYQMGEAIAREITAFDRMGFFAPGEYRLIKPHVKIGESHRGTSSGPKGGKTIYRHLTMDIRRIREVL